VTDVVLLRLAVRPGFGERFVDAFAGVSRRIDGTRIEDLLYYATADVLEDEGLYTESIFVERTDDGYCLAWYMEAEDRDRVVEAYEASDNPVTDLSEWVLGRVLENPGRAFDPDEWDEVENLVHVASPGRPGHPVE
jgi:hypothetical protein